MSMKEAERRQHVYKQILKKLSQEAGTEYELIPYSTCKKIIKNTSPNGHVLIKYALEFLLVEWPLQKVESITIACDHYTKIACARKIAEGFGVPVIIIDADDPIDESDYDVVLSFSSKKDLDAIEKERKRLLEVAQHIAIELALESENNVCNVNDVRTKMVERGYNLDNLGFASSSIFKLHIWDDTGDTIAARRPCGSTGGKVRIKVFQLNLTAVESLVS